MKLMKKIYKAIYILLIGCLTSVSLAAKDISVVFRYDDFTLTHDTQNEKIVQLFQKYNIPLVLGVIPFDASGNVILQENFAFLPLLKQGVQNQTIEIALHGFNHAKMSSIGEFGNVPMEEQSRRINLGKQFLDNVFQYETVTFIPPWNAYDENTLKVMGKSGMKIISSSLTVNQPYSNEEISYFPHTIDKPALLIPTLDKNKNRSGVIILMFHHYDIGKTFTLLDLDNLLSKVSKYDVNFTTFKGLMSENEIATDKRFRANLEVNLMSKLMNMHGVLYSTCRNFLVRILNLFLYLLIVVLIYLLPLFFLAKIFRVNLKNIIIYGLILLMICGIAVWFHWSGPFKLMIIGGFVSLFSSFATIMLLYLKMKKHEA